MKITEEYLISKGFVKKVDNDAPWSEFYRLDINNNVNQKISIEHSIYRNFTWAICKATSTGNLAVLPINNCKTEEGMENLINLLS